MRVRAVLAPLVVVAGLLAGCTHATVDGHGAVRGAGPAPFGQRDVDRLEQSLARVGVGVYRPGDVRPEVPITGASAPVRLSDDQARAAALGVWAHAGLSGAKIDAVVPATTLRAGSPALPAAAVIAGWAAGAHTPSSALAASLLGRQGLASYETAVYPAIVLTLFASDVAAHAAAARGTYRPVPTRFAEAAPAHAAAFSATGGGICTAVLGFVNNTINAVFDSIGHLDTDSGVFSKLFGGFAGRILDGITSLGAAIVNKAIDTVHAIVVQGTRIVLGPFLDAIATVAGAVAVATSVVQLLQPWAGQLVAAPPGNSKGVAQGNPGDVRLTVRSTSGPTGDWPTVVQDCAVAVGVRLPPLRPHGGKLTWSVAQQHPAPLLVTTSADPSLSDTGTAALHYLTTTEDAETAKGESHAGLVLPEVTIHRTDLKELADKIGNLFTGAIPHVPDFVKPILHGLLTKAIDFVTARIDELVADQTVSSVVLVTYHTPGHTDRTTGGCSSSATGTYSGAITATGSLTRPGVTLRMSGSGHAVLSVSPKGRLSGTWTFTGHVQGGGRLPANTEVDVDLTLTARDGTFGGTLRHPLLSATATESGLLHVGAVSADGPILSVPFTRSVPLTVCPPTITLSYSVPVYVGPSHLTGTTTFTLVRQ